MIGIFCEMTKCGFTSINGDFAFARNAKWALVDDCLLEGIIWLRKYAAPTDIIIGPKFDICRLHTHIRLYIQTALTMIRFWDKIKFMNN